MIVSLDKRNYWQNFTQYFPIIIFTFAFLLRLGLIFTAETYYSPYVLSEHVHIANRILEGKGYSHDWYGLGHAGDGSFMPPVYVAVVLVAKLVFPSMPWLAIQLFQALLSSITIVILYFVGKETFNQLTGMLASVLLTIYPTHLAYVLDIQSLTIETLLIISTVLAFIYWNKRTTWKYTAVLGFTLGLSVLSRSNVILFLPLLFLWMTLKYHKRGFVNFILMMFVFTLVLGPWVVRNYVVHQDIVLVSTNGGYNFFVGNNENADGLTHYPVWDRHPPELSQELATLDEAARDKRLYEEGFSFIQAHPQGAISLALSKGLYFWWFGPDFIQRGISDGYPWYYPVIYMIIYSALLGLSLLGLVISHKNYDRLFIFYAFFLIQMLVSMIFVAGTRYRSILDPLLIMFAAYGLIWICFRCMKYLQVTKIKGYQLFSNPVR